MSSEGWRRHSEDRKSWRKGSILLMGRGLKALGASFGGDKEDFGSCKAFVAGVEVGFEAGYLAGLGIGLEGRKNSGEQTQWDSWAEVVGCTQHSVDCTCWEG